MIYLQEWDESKPGRSLARFCVAVEVPFGDAKPSMEGSDSFHPKRESSGFLVATQKMWPAGGRDMY